MSDTQTVTTEHIRRLHTELRCSFTQACDHTQASPFLKEVVPHLPAARKQLEGAIRESEALLITHGAPAALARLYELGADKSWPPTALQELLREIIDGPFNWLSATLNPDPSDQLP